MNSIDYFPSNSQLRLHLNFCCVDNQKYDMFNVKSSNVQKSQISFSLPDIYA